MPKPFVDRAGSGLHAHVTLHSLETGDNVFKEAGAGEYELVQEAEPAIEDPDSVAVRIDLSSRSEDGVGVGEHTAQLVLSSDDPARSTLVLVRSHQPL